MNREILINQTGSREINGTMRASTPEDTSELIDVSGKTALDLVSDLNVRNLTVAAVENIVVTNDETGISWCLLTDKSVRPLAVAVLATILQFNSFCDITSNNDTLTLSYLVRDRMQSPLYNHLILNTNVESLAPALIRRISVIMNRWIGDDDEFCNILATLSVIAVTVNYAKTTDWFEEFKLPEYSEAVETLTLPTRFNNITYKEMNNIVMVEPVKDDAALIDYAPDSYTKVISKANLIYNWTFLRGHAHWV